MDRIRELEIIQTALRADIMRQKNSGELHREEFKQWYEDTQRVLKKVDKALWNTQSIQKGEMDANWCIIGSSLRPCWNCKKDTHNVSLAFETPMCSEECDNEKYKWYEEEVEKMINTSKEEWS